GPAESASDYEAVFLLSKSSLWARSSPKPTCLVWNISLVYVSPISPTASTVLCWAALLCDHLEHHAKKRSNLEVLRVVGFITLVTAALHSQIG
ncbi:MAG: hypothetical protein WBD68_07005, partial [Candidatus Sulfotelmatobacter sp.]